MSSEKFTLPSSQIYTLFISAFTPDIFTVPEAYKYEQHKTRTTDIL